MIIKNSKIITYASILKSVKELKAIPQHVTDPNTGVTYNRESVSEFTVQCDHILALLSLESNSLLQLENIDMDEKHTKMVFEYLLDDIVKLDSIYDILSVHMDMIGGINDFSVDIVDGKLIYTSDSTNLYNKLDEMYRALHEIVEDNIGEPMEVSEEEQQVYNRAVAGLREMIDITKSLGLPKEKVSQCTSIAETNLFLLEELLKKFNIEITK